jgi:hypothetical protein
LTNAGMAGLPMPKLLLLVTDDMAGHLRHSPALWVEQCQFLGYTGWLL